MEHSLISSVNTLWAKKKSTNETKLWLPLIIHLIDTKNTINWLFNHWLSDNQRAIIKNNLSENEIQNLIKFIGFVHDIGKATPAFQIKQSYNHDGYLDHELLNNLIDHGFIDIDNVMLSNPQQSPHNIAGEAILENFGVNSTVGAIIGGHHGIPLERVPKNQILDYTANYYQCDTASNQSAKHIQRLWKSIQFELLNMGLRIGNYQAATELPVINQTQAILIEGLLIMSDWLSSSEYLDEEHNELLFPLIDLTTSATDIDTDLRFQHAIFISKLDNKWTPQYINPNQKPYMRRWGFQPHAIQTKITNAIEKTINPGIIIIEAPMGIGKTEIALLAAEQLAYKNGDTGLFFGLPTQATTNAMFERVNTWLSRLAKNQNHDLNIKLMHGKAEFNHTYQKLPINDSVMNNTSIINTWFSGKKSILTDFTIGTIDNLLLMSLKQKHLFLKHLGLSNKVIIIDEVHAYDSFMNQYLYKTLTWLGTYNIPIVILSATLPMDKRNALIMAYLKGKLGKKYRQLLQAPANWDTNMSYPLITISDANQLIQLTDSTVQQNPTNITVTRLNLTDNAIIQHVLCKIKDGGVAGIIVDTVKHAQALANLLPTHINTILLHSHYLASDREYMETKLQHLIGKDGHRPEKLVVIGTQVLEQSLDIDFDVLYTEIAPIDLILQRLGRLHRHPIPRPSALKNAQVYILGAEQFGTYNKTIEQIYPKYLLMKSDYVLKFNITLPNDISYLVQTVYNDKLDSDILNIEQPKKQFERAIEHQINKASIFQIGNPNNKPNVTIHGWLTNNQLNIDKSEQQGIAAVRDIRETIEVILLKQTENGIALLNNQLIANTPSKSIAKQTIRLPRAITSHINSSINTLETITSKYCPQWQSDPWLKGCLLLLLDEHLIAHLNNYQISYSSNIGLTYTKETGDK